MERDLFQGPGDLCDYLAETIKTGTDGREQRWCGGNERGAPSPLPRHPVKDTQTKT